MKWIRTTSLVFLLTLATGLASVTQVWRQDTAEEFEKGNATNITITSDGQLLLAPQFERLYESSDASFWTVTGDSKGRVFAAGGNDGNVYIYADSKGKLFFHAPEIEVHALAVDAKDNLYVGTSPAGKIYKIAPDGSSQAFYSPGERYIWSMTFDPQGNLYVATGEGGKIFEVDSQGTGKVLFNSQEKHIRCLAADSRGNLIAGSESQGRIYRLSPNGQPAVLYDTQAKEITSVVVAEDGSIYAAAIGRKDERGPSLQQPARIPGIPSSLMSSPAAEAMRTAMSQVTALSTGLESRERSETPGSEIYRIAPDGSPRQIWRAEKTTVFALALSPDGALLAGTGDKGAIYRIEPNGQRSSTLLRAEPSQVTALWRSRVRPVVYAATSNLSRLFVLQPEFAREGSYESQVHDTVTFSRWGRVMWRERVHTAGRVRILTRSGNTDRPDNTWSDWSEASPGITSPPARFIQWKLMLTASDPKQSPAVDTVDLAYVPRNDAPRIENLTIQPLGVAYTAIPVGDSMQQVFSQGPIMPGGNQSSTQASTRPRRRPPTQIPPRQMMKDGYRTVTWTARDLNEDDLIFSLYIRGAGEKEWKLLKDKIEDNFYSWDTRTLPDGSYMLRLVASDEKSNPPEVAERSERLTERFDIDNTPPSIIGLTSESLGGGKVRLQFTATDSATPISEAWYAVDVGEPRVLLSSDGILDSESESFDITIPGLSSGEHVMAIRVKDAADNIASAKVIVTLGAAQDVQKSSAPPAATAKKVLIVMDERPQMEALAKYLSEKGNLGSEIVDQKTMPEDWSGYLAVIGYVHGNLEEKAERKIIDYTRNGGRFVCLHHMISSGKSKNKYYFDFLGVRMDSIDLARQPAEVGGHYAWREGIEQTVVNLNPKHYITSNGVLWPEKTTFASADSNPGGKEYPAFALEDSEAYMNVKFTDGKDKTFLLGYKYLDDRNRVLFQEMTSGWLKPSGKGWIIYLQPGHSLHEYQNVAVAQMVLNAITWKPSI